MPRSRDFLPVVYCRGVNPIHAESSRPDRKRRPSPIAATSAFAITGEVEVFLNPFEEKLDEDETEGTIYARIPASLRRKIEAAAEAEGLSANSWASTVDHDPLPSATPRLKTVGNAVHRWY
jgi:HicB family